MSLVNRITQIATSNDLTLAKIERIAGFGNGTIRRWDISSPSADKLFSVANILNTNIEYLLTGKDKQESRNLSNDERELLEEFRKLDFKGKSSVMQTILNEQERMKLQKNQTESTRVG